MKKKSFQFLTALLLVGWTGTAMAQQGAAKGIPLPGKVPAQPKVRPEVFKTVQEKGVAKVGVVLNGQWELDSNLSKEASLLQRQAIAAAQKSLLAELAGTRYKVLSNSKIGPYMSLEVGPDALVVLESSSLVKDVYLQEMLLRPGLLQSVPLIEGDQAWAAGYDGTGHAVVIVDTGVDGNHPFLSGKVITEACFSFGSNCPNGQTSEADFGAGIPCSYAPD